MDYVEFHVSAATVFGVNRPSCSTQATEVHAFRFKGIRFNPTSGLLMFVKQYGSANIHQTKSIQIPQVAEGLVAPEPR